MGNTPVPGQRLPVVVADDEALPLELGIGILERPGRREATLWHQRPKLRLFWCALLRYKTSRAGTGHEIGGTSLKGRQ